KTDNTQKVEFITLFEQKDIQLVDALQVEQSKPRKTETSEKVVNSKKVEYKKLRAQQACSQS
ncbi:34647_t:CDS:2, partial [Gigaspora margarita]